jgi:mono/diheme cytochrome c family protein
MKALAIVLLAAASLQAFADDAQVKRGRYVVAIAGCNDCHTPNFAPSNGKVPEAQWLTGDALGWRGPWGTTYATNLRLALHDMTEEQWVAKAKKLVARPPMPWFNVQRMSERDLRAIYHYVRHLGPAGKPVPAYVPPDRTPAQPYVQFPG